MSADLVSLLDSDSPSALTEEDMPEYRRRMAECVRAQAYFE